MMQDTCASTGIPAAAGRWACALGATRAVPSKRLGQPYSVVFLAGRQPRCIGVAHTLHKFLWAYCLRAASPAGP